MEARKTNESGKEAITRTIDYLKKDIQRILDKRRTITEGEEVRVLDEEKKIKIKALKDNTSRLKAIHKRERDAKKKENELKRAERAFDSIEFGAARRKRDSEAMTRAKKAKETREKAKIKFNEYMEYQAKYKEVEPEEYLGILFLHEKILSTYGMCPYIKIEISDNEIWDEKDRLKEQLREQIRQKRLQWLQDQEDEGAIYYDLYKKLIERIEIREIELKRDEIFKRIGVFLEDHITEQQKSIVDECCSELEYYTNSLGKTKKIKECYKNLIHKLSILYAETSLNIHEYLGVKYKYELEVNDIARKVGGVRSNVFIQEEFNSYIQTLRELNEAMDEKQKYTSNIVRNLENDLYLYLTEQKTIETTVMPKQCQQVGKYFKRWGVLTENERNERFTSYAEYHVARHMSKEKIKDDVTKTTLVEDLQRLLIDAYNVKRLIYRDFKWNTTKGFIEMIKVLKYDNDANMFILTDKAGKRNKEPVTTPKKIALQKTVMTDAIERVIHEEILNYIVKRSETVTQEDKGLCIDKIKTKLNLKKIGTQDKKRIEDKFVEILQVIQSNKSD
jgi:hypothetical protein